jgi:hypothetical protein
VLVLVLVFVFVFVFVLGFAHEAEAEGYFEIDCHYSCLCWLGHCSLSEG